MISDFANHTGFLLRKFAPKDLETFVELGGPTCAFMHGREGGSERVTQKNFAAFVKDYAFEPETEIYVIESTDKQVIGQLWLHITNNRFNGLKECWIWDLTVREDRRHQGFGKALLEFAKERAISQSCGELWLLVSSKNDKAIDMYRSSGLAQSGHLMSISL